MVVISSLELTVGVMDVAKGINRGFTQEFQKFVVGSCKLLAVFCEDGINRNHQKIDMLIGGCCFFI